MPIVADLLKKVIAKEIQESLNPPNEFYQNSIDDTALVGPDGDTVVLPQAGAQQEVVKNPSEFPLTVETRIDSAEKYALDQFALKPLHVRDIEQLLVSYDKRASVMREQKSALLLRIAEHLLDQWAGAIPAGSIIRTDGDAGDSLVVGATGTRKKVTRDKLVKLVSMMDTQDIPDDGNRQLLIPSLLHSEMLTIDGFVDYQKRGLVDLIGKGFIGEIMGCKVKKRSRGALFSTAAAFKPYGSTVAATDNMSIIGWHRDFVRRAVGAIDVYINEGKAEYLGSIMNAAVRVGGALSRADKKGIVALVQTNV